MDFSSLHVAMAFTPFAGALALKQIWNRKRQECELRELEQRAEAAKREAVHAARQALLEAESNKKAREEFLARMSHELRTPLNAVIGFSRVLGNNKAGNQRPEDLQMIERVRLGGEQLLRLVDEVLDLSRIEQGELELSLDDTDVGAIARRVVERYQQAASHKGLTLEAELPIGSRTIPLDAARFEQAVRHLVENAVKFTNAGGVKVTLVTDGNHRPARLIVSDTGIGIRPEQIDAIFEPFMQAEAGHTRRYAGVGLGLPLAQRFCDAMGCALKVESQPNVGSRFAIHFPKQR